MTTTSDQVATSIGRSAPAATASGGGSGSRRWWGLGFIGLAQLMVVLDMTIVNIALPHIQQDLHLSDANRQWVVTAYTLAFGGLLLLGGRISDLVGRKRTFVIGLIGFGAASALGGAAINAPMLFGARALQGVFAALLAPSALSLLTVTFSDPRERGKAFGVYGAVAGGGSAIGLIAGGVLTEKLDWRWCMYVNVPIAIVAVLGGLLLLPGHHSEHTDRRLDIPGVLLGCGGLLAIVYGFTEAESRGWGDRRVLALLIGGVVLLALFALVEAKTKRPLLPLHVVTERNRAGAFLAVALTVIAMFGLFLFLTYFFQLVRGYSPIQAGFAFLPMTAAIITGSTQISARLLSRVPPRMLITPGALLAAGGMAVLTQLHPDSSYVQVVLPAEIMLGLGMGMVMMPSMSTATNGVARRDAGVTSATVNTSQQVGGSVGTALLNTIAATAATRYIAAHGHSPAEIAQGTVQGYTTAIWWAFGVLVAAAFLSGVLINTRPKRATVEQHTASHSHGSHSQDGPSAGARLYGRVAGIAGAGLPDAVLTLIDTSGRQVGQASAGTDGTYRLEAPGAGEYVLITSAQAHKPEAAAIVLDSAGQELDVSLGGAARLSGTVRRADTTVTVSDALATLTDASGEVLGSTLTDDEGRYGFDALTPGDYTLAVTHTEHRPTAAAITIREEGTTDLDVELIPNAEVFGTVRDPHNAPVDHARVTLVDADGVVVETVITDSSGTFRFPGVLPGRYIMIVTGFAPSARPLVLDTAQPVRHDMQLSHDAPASH
jgi:EmrB/QacA subfamily drug resistance transporter